MSALLSGRISSDQPLVPRLPRGLQRLQGAGNQALEAAVDPYINHVYITRLAAPGDSRPAVLRDATEPPADDPQPAPGVAEERAAIERCRSYRAEVGGTELRILRGEFHRHTEISGDGGGDGPLDEGIFDAMKKRHVYAATDNIVADFRMLHIFIGYDHILFLLALIVVDRFGTLLKIITALTVAHTITLMLAALGVVSLPSRLIESGIAVTIMYVSLENLWAEDKSHRWMLTFLFGLIHGFGFANVLGHLELSSATFVRCLLAFNAGVELGQIAIVAPIWPVWRLVMRQSWGTKATKVLSITIFVCGLGWFLDRAIGLGWMPF